MEFENPRAVVLKAHLGWLAEYIKADLNKLSSRISELDDIRKEDLPNKADKAPNKTAILLNTNWTYDPDNSNYPYSYNLLDSEVKDESRPVIIFDPSSIEYVKTLEFSPYCNAIDGKITLYVKILPEKDVNIIYWIDN